MNVPSRPHRECARCGKSHSTSNAFLLRCRVCQRYWHHSTCAVPVLTVGDLLRRMQRTNSRESTQTIWDWECSGCQRGASAAEPIELDDEEVEELPQANSSGQKLSIDLTDDTEEESLAQKAKNTRTTDREPLNRLSVTAENTSVGPGATSLVSSRPTHPRDDATSSAAQVLRRMSVDQDRSISGQVLSGGDVELQSPKLSQHGTALYASQLGPSSPAAARAATTSPRPPSDFAANTTTSDYLRRSNYQVHRHPSTLPRSFPIQENREKDIFQAQGPPYPRLPQFFNFVPEFPGGDAGARNSDSNQAGGNPRRAFKRKARRTDPDLTGCEVIFMAKARRKGLMNSVNDKISRG